MSVTLTRADATGHLPVGDRIFIAGHRGMVGSALYRHLTSAGYRHLIVRKRSELDLLDQHAVRRFFADAKIDAVFLAAAKVGGIYANNIYPAEFIYQNLMIEANVIHSAFRSGVRRLLFWAAPASIPNTPVSRSRRQRFSPADSKPPTSLMPSQKLPESSSAKATIDSTERIFEP